MQKVTVTVSEVGIFLGIYHTQYICQRDNGNIFYIFCDKHCSDTWNIICDALEEDQSERKMIYI